MAVRLTRQVTYLGHPFTIHPSPDFLSDALYAGEAWEPGPISAIIERCQSRPVGVIVDAGAMLGTHAVAWATAMPHTIHAFEPSDRNARLLRRNTSHLPNVVIHVSGLSDHAHRARLDIDPGNAGHAALVGMSGPVVVDALDALGFANVIAIKLDVEGHEARVLEGAARTIARDRPILLIEDWTRQLHPDGYVLAESWPDEQTYLWVPA